MYESIDTPKPELWAVTANIVKTREFGSEKERRNGTRFFSGGAKVFVVAVFCGACVDVIVVGRHRGSKKYIHSVVKVNLLENLRLNPIYSPKVHELASNISENGAWVTTSKQDAQEILTILPRWQASWV
ncbi:hypothetical protein [uncultured Pseudoteredinibacter sp.]|uniref:hypothetical protein n=1 Tax=uncultured Pseudoteredinibacter sp. TaxID=1641701 RepID=UPI0026309652|nr:hypothetical protein [uncultured Pseudoteredinibacter sp.]